MQTFKTTMQKKKGEVQLNLSKFLLRYRTTSHSVTGKSPAEMIIDRQIKTRLDLLHLDEIKQTKPKQKDQTTSKNFQIDEKVWVRNYHGTPPLAPWNYHTESWYLQLPSESQRTNVE